MMDVKSDDVPHSFEVLIFRHKLFFVILVFCLIQAKTPGQNQLRYPMLWYLI